MHRCVMVVEDEPVIRLEATLMLEEAGLDVVEFDNAAEALRHLEKHSREIAAVFTDVHLKGNLDGVSLVRQIASTTPDVFLMVTSGHYSARPDGLPREARFVRKPWLPLDVLTALQNAVQERAPAFAPR